MRLEMTGSFDADGSAASSNDLLFLGFHGYSNDESGMVRIINAICATGSPDNTHHANANGNGNVNSNTNRNPAADPPIKPNYISFRGAYTRPYIGSHYWYPDGCSVSERQHECSQVGAEVVCMLQSPVFQRFRKVLITGRIPVVSHDYGVSGRVRYGGVAQPVIQGGNSGHDPCRPHTIRALLRQ